MKLLKIESNSLLKVKYDEVANNQDCKIIRELTLKTTMLFEFNYVCKPLF